MLYPRPLAELIAEFEKLPGVGPKTAQRYAFTVLRMEESQVDRFSLALKAAKAGLTFCSICQNFSEAEICSICADVDRDRTTICVVAEAKDVSALEMVKSYRGTYHVLHGLISPMDGVGPDQLRIKELLKRMEPDMKEVILGTNPTVEGDATALYLGRLITPLGVRVTRLAHGMPIGGELEFADPKTLMSALEFRREV